MKLALMQIKWFNSRGFGFGQRRKGVYYVTHPDYGEKEFNTVWEAQQYVEECQLLEVKK